MRNTRLFTACLCVALGWGAAGCEASDYDAVDTAAKQEASEVDVAAEEMPSLEELTGIIESFYRCALGREVTQVTVVSEPRKDKMEPFPEQYFRVREESSGRVFTVSVYLRSGTITAYGLESPYPKDMEREEPITREQAFEIAKPALDWYGLPLNISEYYVDEYRGERPPRHWSIRRQMSYNGVPVRARFIQILVSMQFAEVGFVGNSPWRGGAVFNPGGMGVVYLSACCYDWGDEPFGHELRFRWEGEPGYQLVRT